MQLDKKGVLVTMLCLSCTYVLSGILSLIQNRGLQIVTFVLVSAENTALFAIYFSYMAVAYVLLVAHPISHFDLSYSTGLDFQIMESCLV